MASSMPMTSRQGNPVMAIIFSTSLWLLAVETTTRPPRSRQQAARSFISG